MIVPQKLEKGDSVYCFSPCSYTDDERVEALSSVISEKGLRVVLGRHTVGKQISPAYFSASDEERLADFSEAITNEEIKAIWCMRGGYGSSRIVDALPYERLALRPKWLIGFSDITLLQLHLIKRYDLCSLHAPMASFLPIGGERGDMEETFRLLMGKGEPSRMEAPYHPYNREGVVKGMMAGGNLSLIVHTIGTSSEPDWEKIILCIEEVGESVYEIERMMIHLKRRGVFSKIKGLIFGQFTEIKELPRPFDMDTYSALRRIACEFDFPFAFDMPIGHSVRNFPFIQGGAYELSVRPEKTSLRLAV